MENMEDSATRCVVVGEDFDSKSVMSSVVPLRGASHEYPERTIIPFVEELGSRLTTWCSGATRTQKDFR